MKAFGHQRHGLRVVFWIAVWPLSERLALVVIEMGARFTGREGTPMGLEVERAHPWAVRASDASPRQST
eukprot:366342-Chlamydomonas_euryale.AAC.7